MFRSIYKLPPGHHLTFRDGHMEVAEYWDLHFSGSDPAPASRGEAVERERELMNAVVKSHLMSDVPLGQAKEISTAEMGKATAGFSLPGLT